jgi:nucleotide-binding universal stress UspA family protein
MFSSIVVAVDESDDSDRVVEVVKRMATGTDLTVILVHAYHVPWELTGLASQVSADGRYLARVRANLVSAAETLLERHRKAIGEAAIRVEEVAIEGNPGQAIVEAARKYRGQAIVVGRRGLGRVERLLLGSVSNHVVRHAQCPVLVVP